MAGLRIDSSDGRRVALAMLVVLALLGASPACRQTQPNLTRQVASPGWASSGMAAEPSFRPTGQNRPAVRGQSPMTVMPAGSPSQQRVAQVLVVGNTQTPTAEILRYIRTRAGQPYEAEKIQDDVRRLNKTRKFGHVRTHYQEVPGGRTVIFEVDEQPAVQEVKYVGCRKISKKKLEEESGIKAGDPLDVFAVDEGRRLLEDFYHGKGFSKARVTVYEGDKPGDRRVVYLINEGPKQRILWTRFIGNAIASDAKLRTKIQSKPGFLWVFKGEVNRDQIDEDREQLINYYRSLGFFRAEVGHPLLDYDEGRNWLVLTFVINEGPRYAVRKLSFVGNSKFSTEELATDLDLKAGQFFHQAEMQRDVSTIKDKYGAIGYVFADVEPDMRFLEEPGQLDLVYQVQEGRRCRAGLIDVDILGEFPHTRTNTVLNRLSVYPGEILDIRELRASERRLRASNLFEFDPAAGVAPRIVVKPPELPELDDSESGIARQPGEPPRFRGQSPDPVPSPASRPSETANPEASDAPIDGGVPGNLIDPPRTNNPLEHTPRIDQSESGQPLIIRGQSPDWEDRPDRPRWQPYRSEESQTRGSNAWDRHPTQRAPDGLFDVRAMSPGRPGVSAWQRRQSDRPGGPLAEHREGRYSNPAAAPKWTSPRIRPPTVIRGQYSSDAGRAVPPLPQEEPRFESRPWPRSQDVRPPAQPYPPAASALPDGMPQYDAPAPSAPPPVSGLAPWSSPYEDRFRSAPGNASPGGDVAPSLSSANGPSINDALPLLGTPPYEDPSVYVPLNPRVYETRTGKLMFSVGVNSDAGLLGSVIVDEQNFDWTRFPRSWEEIRNGTAWRGAGQRFRLEAVPGTQLHKYAVTFQEPYLLDTSLSLGLSGFFYNRRYREWEEERVGGRVAVGYQLTHDLSTTFAFRGARINIFDPAVPQGLVDDLDEVLGKNSLFGFRLQLTHDTRDNAFLATEGHLFEIGAEQVLGDFQYARGDIDVRKYFLLRQHPDGSGRHVLSLNTRAAITSDDTPLYEHYYAGGFSTIRGFDFRGASPRDAGTGMLTGGHFMLLGSVEYMFPITADDNLRAVVFCDTGTVEPSIDDWTDKYRVAPGLGLRISIPAMGPAPIALDFAFPISSERGDDEEVFSFFVGFLR